MSSPYDEGYQADRDSENPYEEDTKEFDDWDDGYWDAHCKFNFDNPER